MVKSPENLEIGDIIYLPQAGSHFEITNIIPFYEGITFSGLTVANGTTALTAQEISDLESPKDEIYYLALLEFLRDVKLNKFGVRDRNVLGTKGNGTIQMSEFPIGSGYPLSIWLYNFKPTADVVNNLSLNLSATDCIAFIGYRLKLRKVTNVEQLKEQLGVTKFTELIA